MNTKVPEGHKTSSQDDEKHHKTHKLIIPGRLPSMNEIIKASKAHYGQYSGMKNKFTNLVAMEARKQKIPVMKSVDVQITWYCKNKRIDPDNTASGVKFLLDGLVKAGRLPDDGFKHIGGIRHLFEVDKQNERVEVVLEEIEKVG